MAATGKIITLSGYIYKPKNQELAKYPYKFVSPTETETESVLELIVKSDDMAKCEKLVWEEVEIKGEQQKDHSLKLISIAPVTNKKGLSKKAS